MCATTSNIEHWSQENFQQHVLEPIVTAVKYLASRNVDYIIHTGMPVVTTRGKGFEDELVKQIEEATGLPATTSIRSAIRALAHLGVSQGRRGDALSAGAARVGACPFSPRAVSRWWSITPWTWSSSGSRTSPRRRSRPPPVRSLASAPSADGVYIPCNQWSAADAAPLIERRAPNSGGDRRPRRLLGGVSLGRHPRSDRGSRETDAQSQRSRQRQRWQRARERVFRLGDTAMRANPIRSLTLLAAMTIVALASMPSAAQDFPTQPGPLYRALRRGRQRRPAGSPARRQACRHLGTAGRGRQPRRRRRPDRDRVCGALGSRRLYALSRHRRSADGRREPLQARALRLEARLRAGLDAGDGLSGPDRRARAARDATFRS